MFDMSCRVCGVVGRKKDGRWKMEERIFVATAGPVDDVQL